MCLHLCFRQHGQVAKKAYGIHLDSGVKNYKEINRLNAECLANVAP